MKNENVQPDVYQSMENWARDAYELWFRPWQGALQALSDYQRSAKGSGSPYAGYGTPGCHRCGYSKHGCRHCRDVVHHRSTHCGHSHCHERCDRCGCCLPQDADLIIEARSGERRIVPLLVENPRPRETKVHLRLGTWVTESGKPVELNAKLSDSELILPACGEARTQLSVELTVDGEQQQFAEDRCNVFTSTIHFDGCGAAPITVALAVVGNECKAMTYRCLGCAGCCD